MTSGIKLKDIEVGNGQEVKEDDSVLVDVRFFLNKGEEVEVFKGYPDHQFFIKLKSRDFIPGLRSGIVGMREGGTREVKISPHLAFGDSGVPDRIPPNAVIICKVKLLKITDEHFSPPDPFERKRQIVVSHRGEAARNLPRWNFGVINDGEYELTVNHPIPGMTWRHTRNKTYNGKLDQSEMDQIFEEAQKFPQHFPNDVVPYDNVWSDTSESAGNTPRERTTNRLCIYVSVFYKPNPTSSFYVTEDNQQFQNTLLYRFISASLKKAELQ